MENNLVWLKAKADNGTDIIKFAIDEAWLRELIKGWATEDVNKDDDDKELYIEGRTDQLLEMLDEDVDSCNYIYEVASKENKIIECGKPQRESAKEYMIHDGNMEKIQDLIDKINKRSKKLGQNEIKLSIVESVFEEIMENTPMGKIGTGEFIKLNKVIIEADEIKVDGYEFIGTLNHTYSEEANVVKTFNNIEMPERFRTAKPYCDHCKTNRFRKETVILRNPTTDEYLQVGKSCLKDFNGYDIHRKLEYMYLLEELEEQICITETNVDGFKFSKYTDVKYYLELVISCIKKYGWLSNTKVREEGGMSTSMIASRILWKDSNYLTEDEREIKVNSSENEEQVVSMLRWLEEQEVTSDYMSNLKLICSSGYINGREEGICASLVVCYMKAMELLKQKELKEQKPSSSYYGEIGEKIQVDVEIINTFIVDTYYGTMYINKMVDAEGHIFIWKTSSKCLHKDGVNLNVTIKATVKDHTEYNDELQTEVLRVKII